MYVVVEPREKVGGIPVGGRRLPVAVAPHDVRLVRVHELIQLGHCLRPHEVLLLPAARLI